MFTLSNLQQIKKLDLTDEMNWECDEKNFRIIGTEQWITEPQAYGILKTRTNLEEEEIEYIFENCVYPEDWEQRAADQRLEDELRMDGVIFY